VREAAELEAKKKGKRSKLDVQHLDDLAVAKH
jgi:hypothetical protein